MFQDGFACCVSKRGCLSMMNVHIGDFSSGIRTSFPWTCVFPNMESSFPTTILSGENFTVVFRESAKVIVIYIYIYWSTINSMSKKVSPVYTLPETNIAWKMLVGKLLSFWEGQFSEAMSVSGRVSIPGYFIPWIKASQCWVRLGKIVFFSNWGKTLNHYLKKRHAGKHVGKVSFFWTNRGCFSGLSVDGN